MKCKECNGPVTVGLSVGVFCSVECYERFYSRTKKTPPIKLLESPVPTVKVGSLVKYVDTRGHEHTALVLEVKPKGMLRLKVFRGAQPNVEMEVGQGRWKR